MQKKNSIVFDTKQPDRAVEMYDTSKDKIIGAFVSEEENIARRMAANDAGVPLGQIVYSIYEMNLDGADMNLVTNIKASILIRWHMELMEILLFSEGKI